jgi:hypothetical protein
MKMYLTTILLCIAIWLTALGAHTNNLILIGIGGFFAGAYNAIIYKQD